MVRCFPVLRETVFSYTITSLLHKEHSNLLDALHIFHVHLGRTDVDDIYIRVDPVPGMEALAGHSVLHNHDIFLEVSRIKNINKNPIAERTIEEPGMECLCLAYS